MLEPLTTVEQINLSLGSVILNYMFRMDETLVTDNQKQIMILTK